MRTLNTLDGYKDLEDYCKVSLNKLIYLESIESNAELDSIFNYKNCYNDNISSDTSILIFSKLPTKKENGEDVFALTFSEENNGIIIATLVYMEPVKILLEPNNNTTLDHDFSCRYGSILKFMFLKKNNCVYKIFSLLMP